MPRCLIPRLTQEQIVDDTLRCLAQRSIVYGAEGPEWPLMGPFLEALAGKGWITVQARGILRIARITNKGREYLKGKKA